MEKSLSTDELISLLPRNYINLCYETKTTHRARELKEAHELMPICLNYLYGGLTLLELSAFALLKGYQISDVALMEKMAHCSDWYKAIISEMQSPQIANYTKPVGLEEYEIFANDGSDIVPKGRGKKAFRLHYSINIFSLSTAQFKITDYKTGESLKNFKIKAKQVHIADRAYGTKTSIEHCLNHGGDIIVRLQKGAFTLYDAQKNKIVLTEELKKVTESNLLDYHCFFENADKKLTPIRICAIRKTPENIEKTQIKIARKESRKQINISADAKFMNNFIVLATTLTQIAANEILEIYRYRWQVELYFKRLKSILCIGEVPNKKEEHIIAWLNGKMMTALLIEQLFSEVSFSP